ncbi:16S rRNA pseudouridine(516) synthase [Enterococcus cecorum]|uniref:16S rRNA pseudouridine(516) synthase n=1 Tax=Enterococcus cecorum TaxID=44008 RepID=UPI000640FF23|nr:16S rRNA pseudouridine(516) synthase [Enterococcus cecorum]KLN92625.1 pseudouridylate synthase [Enterococcus cecorum]KLN92813.1 pseudouridylate synthase [Enterococcus cecorum]KLO66622.1 pseudouridylate synthase [Enterococcus cecorum]KLO74676.1 pseudouridylate synthase [Enterococcus cecorum]MCJ0535897.1 pseudouridine synthase [Enterococcus cecorum]
MRLGTLIMEQLQLSRKMMKRTFLRGVVKVDGQVEYDEARNVDSQIHHIEVAGQTLHTTEVYYLLHKPSGVVTANKDATYQTVFDCLKPKDRREDLCFVGRLDRYTQGLILLTSNGQLAYDLLQPSKKVSKVYEAYLKEPAEMKDIESFKQGIRFIDDTVCLPAKLTILSDSPHHVLVEIHEGKFHQVKKMFLAVGKKVKKLKRISFGPLQLPSDLPIGDYRKLTREEIISLKEYFR